MATPSSSHADDAIRAIAAGNPVPVEKPMARDRGECLRMIEAARAAGVPLFVACYRRRPARFLRVKQLVRRLALEPHYSRMWECRTSADAP